MPLVIDCADREIIGWRISRNGKAQEEAERMINKWVIKYNTYRPHESLGWLAPAESKVVRPTKKLKKWSV